MKKLLLALCLSFGLGFSALPAKANFSIDYMDSGDWAQVQWLGVPGYLGFIYFCWSYNNCYYPDIFTLHSDGYGAPLYATLAGAPLGGMGYRLWWYYDDGYYWWYEVYVTNNYGNSWTYIGDFAL